jgi:predicted permease
MARKEAEAKARREFGSVTLAEQDSREVWRWPSLENLLIDIRYGLRLLRRSPGFTAAALLTLALGIGANAAVFGLLETTLLGPLPFRDPQNLIHVWTIESDGDVHTPHPAQYLAIQKYGRSFEQVAGLGWVDDFYGSDQSALQNLPGLVVTASWLPTLGVQPFLGRNFLEDEQMSGRDAVVILSYGCWRNRFHADPGVIGSQITVNRRSVTIVGVVPQSLGPYYTDAEMFSPLVLENYVQSGNVRAGAVRLQIIARLKRGVTLAQARSEMEELAHELRRPLPATDRSGQLVVEQFAEEFRNTGPTRKNAQRGLWIMAAAAGLVLLIACANVASLLLARGIKRHREIAVRSALGCSRGRMIRQLLTESALLFLFGGGLGLLAARWSEDFVSKAAAGIVSSATFSDVNSRVLASNLLIALLSALLFGMIPALQATRLNLNDHLKDAPANATGGWRSRRSRNLLVVCQIALGMVLIVCFGLLFRSFQHVESSPLGFDAHNVLTATAHLPLPHYPDPSSQAALTRAVLGRIRSMPGVESAGITRSLPMEGAESAQLQIETPAHNGAPLEDTIYFVPVSPGYFSTLKIPMFAGREFQDSDSGNARPVVIVNEKFAQQYFPGANPIGYHLAFVDSPAVRREIVGVVSDFRQRNPEEDERPLAYFPVAQSESSERWSLAIRVRAASDMKSAAAQINNWLRYVDPELNWDVSTMQQEIHGSESLTLRRPIVTLLASFGVLALFLALVGVFGVVSYSVAERTREIGLRIALGAARREVAALVLRESLVVALAGMAVGTLCALGVARVFPTSGIGWSGSGIFLYGVSRTDPITYILAAALLTSVVLAASWIPARRAMRVDPMVALRYE